MRNQSAANVDPLFFNEIFIHPDCGKLQRLVEFRRDAGSFKIVENKIHNCNLNWLLGHYPQHKKSAVTYAAFWAIFLFFFLSRCCFFGLRRFSEWGAKPRARLLLFFSFFFFERDIHLLFQILTALTIRNMMQFDKECDAVFALTIRNVMPKYKEYDAYVWL